MKFIIGVWIIFAILGGCAIGALLSKCNTKPDKYQPNYEHPTEARKEL